MISMLTAGLTSTDVVKNLSRDKAQARLKQLDLHPRRGKTEAR